jgi:hypothetical protein
MKSIQISSPETERKIACLASAAFMILAWLFVAWFLARVCMEGHPVAWFLGSSTFSVDG